MKKIPRRKAEKRTAASFRNGYIISPAFDFWVTGGVSIVVVSVMLVYLWWAGGISSSLPAASVGGLMGSAIIFQVLINWPHFIGAYSLLYRPRTNLKKYPLATIYVPLALILIVAAAVFLGTPGPNGGIAVHQDLVYVLWLGAAFYLAWHYTGQTWGMVACFSKLTGLELSPGERRLLRVGLRTLLVWHVVWGAQDLPAHWLGALHSMIPAALRFMNLVCCCAFLVGVVIWFRIGARTGRAPDRRILASWLAIYMWYLLLFFEPAAYLIVQFSHSLQYLVFPLRMELNRAGLFAGASNRTRLLFWSGRYYIVLVLIGLFVFHLPEYFSDLSGAYTFALAVASAVSIHHYFVDSCIWRVRDPSVRKGLFAHLAPGNA